MLTDLINKIKNAIAHRMMILHWKSSGTGLHEDYAKLQIQGSLRTREDPANQKDILTALDKFYSEFPDRTVSILDAGCGDGWTLDQLRAKGYTNLRGIDISSEKVKTAREFGHQAVEAVLPDIPFPPEHFDVILNRHVFEHLLFPERVLQGFYQALKPGGKLFLIVPKTEVGPHVSEAHVQEIKSIQQVKRWMQNVGFYVSWAETHQLQDEEIWILAEKKKEAGKSLRFKTLQGISVVGALQGIRWIFNLFVTVFLYRTLSVEDFGIFAICEMCLAICLIFAEHGMESVVIQRGGRDVNVILQSGFIIRTAATLVVFFALLIGAPLIASFSGNINAAEPLRIASIILIVGLITFKTESFLKKRIEFKSFLAPEITSGLISAIFSLFFAFMGFGYWSLVIAMISSQIVRAMILIIRCPRPLFEPWDPQTALSMWRDARYSLSITLLFFVIAQTMHLVVGRYLGTAALGFYYLAFNWANAFVTQIVQLTNRVLFPAVSSLEGEKPLVQKAYHEYLGKIAFVGAPVNALLFVLAPTLIPLALGEKWLPAVIPCQIMCLHGYMRSLSGSAHTILQSLGQFKTILKCLVIETGILCAGVAFAISQKSLEEVALAMAASKVMSQGILFYVAGKKLNESMLEAIKIVIPSFLAGFGMIGAASSFIYLIPDHSHPVLTLMGGCAIGLPTYVFLYGVLKGKGKLGLQALINDVTILLGRKSA